ncbi:MAG: shikimate kinase, partial [Alloscardovia omnicolens]|nr:shikimate kinase [Alloscardovia omnicolens]
MARVPQVVFIGMPGSGKTRIGKEISSLMSVSFYDSDDEIERSEGMRIPDIFEELGERRFREIERDIIADFVDVSDAVHKGERIIFDGVLSLGGGAPMRPETQENL